MDSHREGQRLERRAPRRLLLAGALSSASAPRRKPARSPVQAPGAAIVADPRAVHEEIEHHVFMVAAGRGREPFPYPLERVGAARAVVDQVAHAEQPVALRVVTQCAERRFHGIEAAVHVAENEVSSACVGLNGAHGPVLSPCAALVARTMHSSSVRHAHAGRDRRARTPRRAPARGRHRLQIQVLEPTRERLEYRSRRCARPGAR